MNFQIADIRRDGILGTDWIVKSSAIINLKDQCIRFPETVIPLTSYSRESYTLNSLENALETDEPTSLDLEELIDDNFGNVNDVVINSDNSLTAEESEDLMSLIQRHANNFATDITALKTCALGEHEIRVSADRPRRTDRIDSAWIIES